MVTLLLRNEMCSNLFHNLVSVRDQGALNALSSYSKTVNTPHSQSFVSRTDYTSNPGLIAHAPIAAAYHAPIAAAYHAPIAPAYHAGYHGAPYPYAAAGIYH